MNLIIKWELLLDFNLKIYIIRLNVKRRIFATTQFYIKKLFLDLICLSHHIMDYLLDIGMDAIIWERENLLI